MNLKKILKGVGKGVQIAAPIAEQFGVPGAKTVNEAVMLIHGDASRDNGDALLLMAAQMDHMNDKLKERGNVKD